MAEVMTEVVADVAETVAEEAQRFSVWARAMNQLAVNMTAVGVVAGVATGGVVTYVIVRKRLDTKYKTLADEEIASVKNHYNAKAEAVRERVEKPELDDVVTSLGYKEEDANAEVLAVKEATVVVVPPEVVATAEVAAAVVTRNAFDTPVEDDPGEPLWDYANEVRSRVIGVPFIIHADEFEENQEGHTQARYTYYESDDVLADEEDHAIDDWEDYCGLYCVTRFGHGSNDPNIVFVRNNDKDLDMEITLSRGSYAQEVHGVVQHSDERHHRRPEWDD